MVYTGELFFDEDEKKEREIDVRAVDVDYSLSKGIEEECKVISHLVIEVKKTEKPIVFFKYGKTDTESLPPQMLKSENEKFHFLLFKKQPYEYAVSTFDYDSEESLKKYGLDKHRFKDESLHKTFYSAFTSPSIKNQIFEAIKKVQKATDYQRERYGTCPKTLHIFNLVIVVDGNLWSASLNKSGEIVADKVPRLLVESNRLSDGEEGRYEEISIIDVVTKTHFNTFLKKIKKDNLSIYTAWTNYLKEHKKSRIK